MAAELSITSAGELLIPAERLGPLKGVPAAKLRCQDLPDELLVSSHLQPGQRGKPILLGDLRIFHVAEIMALVAAMHRDGVLQLMVPHARKSLYFTGGEIVYASSTVEDDRLGEALWRGGLLTLAQLSEVHDLVTPKKKLGAVLVERGLLTPRQLYEGIKQQVLEIVYSAFHLHEGEFLFIEGAFRIQGAVRLDLTSREVIMEGVRRVEEMTRLEELFPDRNQIPVQRPVTVDVKLGESERHVLTLLDGRKTVSSVVAESRLGEYEGLRALAHLRQLGLIDVREQPVWERQEAGPMPTVLEVYAKILRTLHQTLKAEQPGYVTRLEAYLGIPVKAHREVFRNVGFDGDGRLDMETLFRNAKAARPEAGRELALEALRAFYDYAIFQAKDVLEPEVCEAMMSRIEALRSRLGPAGKPG
jgi:hypothetical protein